MRLRALGSADKANTGFTIVELVIVIVIIGLVATFASTKLASVSHWKQQGAIRRLVETIELLHHQAVTDQAFYRMEFNLAEKSYKIGILKAEEQDSSLSEYSSELGNLSLELAAFLNPSLGQSQTVIPPPSMPSLAEAQYLPDTLTIKDIQTMRGKESEGKPYILFSPRGFSEFSVLHLELQGGAQMTILVNPFDGKTQLYSEYKDFVWTYGRSRAS